jgi:hypothetical protein
LLLLVLGNIWPRTLSSCALVFVLCWVFPCTPETVFSELDFEGLQPSSLGKRSVATAKQVLALAAHWADDGEDVDEGVDYSAAEVVDRIAERASKALQGVVSQSELTARVSKRLYHS